MPRVSFSISSIPEQTFIGIIEGYYKTEDSTPPTGIRSRVMFCLKWVAGVCRIRRLPKKANTREISRSISPLVDPQFLHFAILVADHLRRGYQVGHIGGVGVFVSSTECSLAPFVPNTITLGERYSLPITPHAHEIEISDVPEYAQLIKLKQITHDASISALLNRLALWLYTFALVHQYGWKIVLHHPKTKERKEVTSAFFLKFWSGMSL